MDNRQYLKPEEIYKRSFKIIQKAFGSFTAPEKQFFIYTKIAHATADVEFAKTFIISEIIKERTNKFLPVNIYYWRD
ncbi:MAG: precorrin-8X methylmutase, partial [Spirochaetales bacterium]|nr:precorrin-8X methylmutase [Spirochaetales bacterium]